MTERSWPHADDVGHGGEYSADYLAAYVVPMLAGGESGVFRGSANELAVTSTGNNNITVDTGRAMVDGWLYGNDASKPITTSSPSGGTTGRLVVLRHVWSTRLVTAEIRSSADGTATIPSPTQSDGDTWEFPLASFTITTGGVIGALTDLRTWVQPTERRLYPVTGTASGTLTTTGDYAAVLLSGGTTAGLSLVMPCAGARLSKAVGVFIPNASDTATLTINVNSGVAGASYATVDVATSPGSQSYTSALLTEVDFLSLLSGLSDGAYVGVRMERSGTATFYFLGVLLEWV